MRQFVETMCRLFNNEKVNEAKIIELYKSGKITEEEKDYILNN